MTNGERETLLLKAKEIEESAEIAVSEDSPEFAAVLRRAALTIRHEVDADFKNSVIT